MNLRPLVLLLALALASPALGQLPPMPPPSPTPAPAPVPAPPVPVVPVATITVPTGSTLVLFGDRSTSITPLSWKLISPKVPFLVGDIGDRRGAMVVVPNAPDGLYKFALVATGSSGSFDFDFAEVTVGGARPPTPPPGPIPPAPPAPTPPPTPALLKPPFWVELVVDPAAVTPKVATLVDSLTIGPAIEAMGGHYQPLATNSAEFGRRNLKSFVGPGLLGAPALLVRDASGAKVIGEPIPKDEAAVLARVQALLGGAK